jgi:hypothetical protein
MAANYQTVIDAIDAAILAGVSGPGAITTPTGGSINYRSLDELVKTRENYVKLLSQETKGGGRRFGMTRIRSGSAQL